MREIKFRAWDGEKKLMYVQDNFTTFVINGHGLWACWYQYGAPDEENVAACGGEKDFLMQFTGLLDKNGVEIYEGDVVEYTSYNCSDADELCCKAVVEFDEGSFLPVSEGYCIAIEVIGNIHQHPHLLGDK